MRPTSLSAAVLFLLIGSFASAQISIQRIAFRGDPVQGALFPNQTISYAGTPLINNAGEVVFESSLTPDTGGGTGAILANSSGLHMVVQRGAPAPGTGGATFDVIGFAPSLNIAGQIGVFGSLEGTGVNEGNRLGSWDGAAGSVQLVMRTGAAAPQYAGATFESTGRPVASDAGDLVIAASVLDPARPNGHGAGIWFGLAGNLQLVMKVGDAAPNSPPGTVVNDFFQIHSTGNGRLAVGISVPGPLPAGIRHVIYTGFANDLHAASDAIAPGTTASFSYLTGVALNRNGQLAINQHLAGPDVDDSNDEGIWAGNPGALQLVARIGEQAPGTSAGTKYSANDHLQEDQWDPLSEPTMNSSGQIAFRARFDGLADNSNNWGIYTGTAGNLKLIARSGEDAPGVSGAKLKGTTAGAEWMAPFFSPIINDAGQVAFVATLEGPGIEEYQSRALYATDTAGLLHLIVREGQMFDVGGGDLRRIASIGLNSEDASENGSSAFNSSGQLAFYLSFEDTSNGVFVATVPEPVMAGWFVLMLLSSKRRKRL